MEREGSFAQRVNAPVMLADPIGFEKGGQ
jgi:hypothetical protein